MTRYVKSHYTVIGAALVAILQVFQNAGHIDRTNVVSLIIAALGVLLSFALQNTAGGVRHYSQAIINTLIVAGQAVAPWVIEGHLPYSQVPTIAVAFVMGVAAFWSTDSKTLIVATDQDAGSLPISISTLNNTNVVPLLVTNVVGRHELPDISQPQPNGQPSGDS